MRAEQFRFEQLECTIHKQQQYAHREWNSDSFHFSDWPDEGRTSVQRGAPNRVTYDSRSQVRWACPARDRRRLKAGGLYPLGITCTTKKIRGQEGGLAPAPPA